MKFGNLPKDILRFEVKTLNDNFSTIEDLIQDEISEDIISFQYVLDENGLSKLWIDTGTRKFHLIHSPYYAFFKERL